MIARSLTSTTFIFRTAIRSEQRRIPYFYQKTSSIRLFSSTQAKMSVQAITSYDDFKKIVSGKVVVVKVYGTMTDKLQLSYQIEGDKVVAIDFCE